MDLLGWVIFIVALMFSVMLHESGHFVAAKKFGMKATRYFVGFGPTVWSTRRGETEYGVKALPLGGFVKIIGMTSMDEVEPEDEARSFRRAPAWQRLIVLGAGSFMHFVLAFVLIFGLALGIGIENDNSTQLGTVAGCVPASAQALNNNSPCVSSDPASPAKLAGLKVGDKVTAFDGVKVSSWTQLADVIKNAHAGSPITITVLRDGRQVTLHTRLAAVKGRSGGYLGIAPAVVFQPAGPIGAIGYAGSAFSQTLTGSVKALGSLPSEVPKLFSKKAASSGNRPLSVVGAAEVTGQAVAANVGWQYKVSFVLLLIASLNIFVGAFNLVPLLPLDGGHIAAVIFESIRSRIARLRRRPDPGLADYRKLVPVSFSIFMIVVFFGVLLLLSNIVNPVSLG
ncbi:MAG: site-2 protease family protein [Streptosporangiaceae bacterium]|nr:site-2 protease family protein [Streptosporangiaceae bacterium]MBV9855312.1 site-2 protease family protein [Streptosporangiaceae bacterium]